MRAQSSVLLFLIAVLLLWCGLQNDGAFAKSAKAAEQVSDGGKTALAIFQKRILPIFQAQKPSSCTECHLSGVDLKDYIHPDQTNTFASLVQSGLVDAKNPNKSKILEFIRRKPEKPDLMTEKIRQEEYEAFQSWINAAVKEPALLAAKPGDKLLGPTLPEAVIRHARADRVLASFIDNVWVEVGRCAACHSPDRNQKQVKEHGERVSWIKLGDPQATLDHMLDNGLIDADEPLKSLILMKPTMQVKHGGGQKMVVGDRTYKQFRGFIDDYAATLAGKYRSARELPEPATEMSAVSEIWLKVTDVPERFDKMLMQVDVYRREGNAWSSHRWATSDRPIFGKGKLWQHSLSLTAPRGSERAAAIGKNQTLPPGRYLVRIYIDQEEKLQKNYRDTFGDNELVGEVEVESRWPSGYGSMTIFRFPSK